MAYHDGHFQGHALFSFWALNFLQRKQVSGATLNASKNANLNQISGGMLRTLGNALHTTQTSGAPRMTQQRETEIGRACTTVLGRLTPYFKAAKGTLPYMNLVRTKLFNMLKNPLRHFRWRSRPGSWRSPPVLERGRWSTVSPLDSGGSCCSVLYRTSTTGTCSPVQGYGHVSSPSRTAAQVYHQWTCQTSWWCSWSFRQVRVATTRRYTLSWHTVGIYWNRRSGRSARVERRASQTGRGLGRVPINAPSYSWRRCRIKWWRISGADADTTPSIITALHRSHDWRPSIEKGPEEPARKGSDPWLQEACGDTHRRYGFPKELRTTTAVPFLMHVAQYVAYFATKTEPFAKFLHEVARAATRLSHRPASWLHTCIVLLNWKSFVCMTLNKIASSRSSVTSKFSYITPVYTLLFPLLKSLSNTSF